MSRKRKVCALLTAAAAVSGTAAIAQVADAGGHHHHLAHRSEARHDTVTPIQHVVVIYQENVSFDHYFGTYPNAANTDGQTFMPAPGTPAVDGLAPATDASIPAGLQHSADLLSSNPNLHLPQRLDSTPTGAAGSAGGQLTCDQDHNYTDEQTAFDGGAMDYFEQSVGTDGGHTTPFGTGCQAKTVMDYYDGNTVTALWNYAQRYAMSDNSYSTTFGPSSPGAINLIAAGTGGVDTNPAHMANNPSIATSSKPNADLTPDGSGIGYSLTSDAQPFWDDCSTRDAVALTGQNIGDLLNAAGVSWGWFEGGLRPSMPFATAAADAGHPNQGTSTFMADEFKGSFPGKVVPPHASNQGICNAVHPVGVALGGNGTGPVSASGTNFGFKDDYIAHHEPFQYYASTANPHHLTIPTDANGNDTLAGLRQIGTDTQSYRDGAPQFDTPNHQYDMSDFDQLVRAIGNGQLPPSALPAVSFLKAPGYQDGHAAYSDPKDEQAFITNEINALMRTPDWAHTAVVIAYDDSDGWYDHANPGVINPSLSPADNLTPTNKTGPTSGQCGPNPQPTGTPLAGEQGRCGFGPRQPLLVISPFAARNHVDHNISHQGSITNMVEYNWRLPAISGSADQVLTSRDAAANLPFDLAGLFDFHGPRNQGPLILDPATGQPAGG